MNGVLLNRGSKAWGNATLRPHLDVLLETLRELSGTLLPAVWSSMIEHNLTPLVSLAFGDDAGELAFVLDQEWCTKLWVPGMHKPLLRKDLAHLSATEWADYMPDHVLLIDDDPVKCTENPEGSAVHPSSFTGKDEDAYLGTDTELLRLSGYLRALVASGGSVPDFVKSRPYEDFTDVPPPVLPVLRGPPGRSRMEVKCAVADPYGGSAPAEPPAYPDWAAIEHCVELGDPWPAKRAKVDPAGMRERAAAGQSQAKSPKAVKAYWPDDDKWLPATVIEKLKDGSCRITWDEDFSESVVPADYVWWP